MKKMIIVMISILMNSKMKRKRIQMLPCKVSRSKIRNFKTLSTSTSNTWVADLVRPISLPKTPVTISGNINLTKALWNNNRKFKKRTALTLKYTRPWIQNIAKHRSCQWSNVKSKPKTWSEKEWGSLAKTCSINSMTC